MVIFLRSPPSSLRLDRHCTGRNSHRLKLTSCDCSSKYFTRDFAHRARSLKQGNEFFSLENEWRHESGEDENKGKFGFGWKHVRTRCIFPQCSLSAFSGRFRARRKQDGRHPLPCRRFVHLWCNLAASAFLLRIKVKSNHFDTSLFCVETSCFAFWKT